MPHPHGPWDAPSAAASSYLHKSVIPLSENTVGHELSVAQVTYLAANDYVEVYVTQAQGNVNVTPHQMGMSILAPN